MTPEALLPADEAARLRSLHYLVARSPVQVPVPAEILKLVRRRLDDVRTLLHDYHLGKNSAPTAQ